MSSLRSKSPPSPGALVRAFREGRKLSLDDLADLIKRRGRYRPSAAKLSRIETGLQPVPTDILAQLAAVMGIAPHALRPDLAALFAKSEAA